ncbi:MAG: FHA domain-containing protein [Planctomycetota bacterium]|nr:FHA domain-containing protein [Planctomycetota bacterium]
MARLIIKSEDGERTIEIEAQEITSLGRDPGNTVALEDARGASRRHCQITPVRRAGQPAYELTDLGATNKTRVNGKPVDRAVLNSGDVIQIGSAELTFEDPEEEERLRSAGRQGVCYLEWVTGGTKGEKVMLDQTRVSLGRRDSNTIPLKDRMSSGHHCEITKDLNGYTIRDLGSTNGTLVNGEPTSEAPLTHGARIRIGNTRFVFKDPSMKDIEVELSQFDEDEGWGMMGDIDLTKARGSYAGLLVGLVILAGAGVGGWFISQQAEQQQDGGAGGAVVANEVDNGSMDDAEFVPWALDTENDDVSVRIAGGGKPGNALQVSHGGEAGAPVTAYYQDEFEALADKPFRVEAWFRGGGEGNAALVATWSSDNNAVSHTMVLASGEGWSQVDRVLVKPKWAGGLRLGVHVAPGANGRVDGVRVTRSGEGDLIALDSPGSSRAAVTVGGTLDLVDSVGRALALGVGPVVEKNGTKHTLFVAESVTGGGSTITVQGAFQDAEDPIPATVTWTQNEEGFGAEVACSGATRVGLKGGLVRARVGDLVNVLTPRGAQALAASGGQAIPQVLKTLAGNPDAGAGGRMSLITLRAGAESELVIADALDTALLDLTHWLDGASGSVAVVTDYTLQSKQAQSALQAARELLRDRPGEGIEKLREVAVEFPFEKAIVTEALNAASTREAKANKDITTLGKALASFQIYRSDEALSEVEGLRKRLAAEFPPREGGVLEDRVTALVTEVDRVREAYYQEVRGPELTRLENLAALLQNETGYEAMAVLYLRTIVEEFGSLDADTPLGRRVQKARESLAALLEKTDLAETVPPPPGGTR